MILHEALGLANELVDVGLGGHQTAVLVRLGVGPAAQGNQNLDGGVLRAGGAQNTGVEGCN